MCFFAFFGAKIWPAGAATGELARELRDQTPVTLKTESPDGLLSGRRLAEVDPPWSCPYHPSRLGCGIRLSLERSEPLANARLHERGEWWEATTPARDYVLVYPLGTLY